MKILFVKIVFVFLLFSCNNQKSNSWKFEKVNSKINKGLDVEDIVLERNQRYDLDSTLIYNRLNNKNNNKIKECKSACCSQSQ